MVGLGQVDELEVKGEGARQAIGLHSVQRLDAAQCAREWLSRLAILGFAAANGDLPQLFHFAKELLARLLAQDLAQKHAQRTDVAPQRRLFDVARAGFQFSQTKGPVLRFPKQSHCL